jgi:ubiquinol-cytochrome c reductase iron-sulfur subunit
MDDTPPIDEMPHDQDRRDFLKLAATSVGVVGICAAAWPFVNSMNPAADTMAVASIEVDISTATRPKFNSNMAW